MVPTVSFSKRWCIFLVLWAYQNWGWYYLLFLDCTFIPRRKPVVPKLLKIMKLSPTNTTYFLQSLPLMTCYFKLSLKNGITCISEVVSRNKSFIIEVNNRVLWYLNIFRVSGFKTEYKYNPTQKNLKKRGRYAILLMPSLKYVNSEEKS